MTETVYIAIYKTEEMTVTIEYKPLTSEWDFGAIEILSVDIQPARPSTWKDQRKTYQRGGLVTPWQVRERTRTFKTK